jgi:HTH-type transcriptional repressor of puuD
MSSPTNIGNLLRQSRESAGLSQRKLARLSGLSNALISSIEKGDRTPSIESLERLAEAMGLSLIIDFAGGKP